MDEEGMGEVGDGGKMRRKEEDPQIPSAALEHLLEAPDMSSNAPDA